jgi:nicotinamidase-related amidase
VKTKISYLDAKKTVLLVIDMQNAFIEKGRRLEVRGIRRGVPKLRRFIDHCREKGILVIYTRHYYAKTRNPISSLLFSNLLNRGLNKNEKGFEIHNELHPKREDLVIDKNRYDVFSKTKLNQILRSRKVKNIIITGTMTQVCCETTGRSAMGRDYITIFCSDLTFCGDKNIQMNTLQTFDKYFGWVLDSNEIGGLIK